MNPGKCLCVCMLLLFCVAGYGHGGNVLVWYSEGSHWINTKPLLEKLSDRGHQVTVLVPNASLFMNSKEPSRFRYEPFNVSVSMEYLEERAQNFFNFFMYKMDHMNYFQIFLHFMDLMELQLELYVKFLDGVLKSDGIMAKLKEGKYDLLLADPIYPGSDLLANILDVPLIISLRFSFAHHWERHCGQLPAPPSFVPAAMSELTDKMTFSERLWNFLFYAFNDVLIHHKYWRQLDSYYTEITGKPTSACEMLGNADIWLMRTSWDFGFPRPFLPNFKFVGGMHCSPAKPLPEDMEEFVQSSGDAGIVVFTLGSMIKNIKTEKANMIASALAQLPQKVLWRYSGEKPKTLGANTRIYDWIPQNDLLGHPKTKAFVTHGGSNGLYEAIYHGVPLVGIPLFGDQSDNLAYLKNKGVATIVSLNFMTTEDLRDAIKAVTDDKSYKENVMQLSRIHHDRPTGPLDEAIFWIEFTIRNKGAKHLRVQAHELTWYQYHSLDVLAFFLAVVLLLVLLFVKTCSYCFWRCCGKKGRKKRKAE